MGLMDMGVDRYKPNESQENTFLIYRALKYFHDNGDLTRRDKELARKIMNGMSAPVEMNL